MGVIYISPGHFSTFSVGCPFFSLKIRLAVQRLFWYETSPRIYRRESSEYTWIARKYHLLTDDGDEIQDGWKMRSTLYSMSEYNNNERLDREWYVLRIKICRKAFLERDGFEGWKRAPHVYPFCCWDQLCIKEVRRVRVNWLEGFRERKGQSKQIEQRRWTQIAQPFFLCIC